MRLTLVAAMLYACTAVTNGAVAVAAFASGDKPLGWLAALTTAAFATAAGFTFGDVAAATHEHGAPMTWRDVAWLSAAAGLAWFSVSQW